MSNIMRIAVLVTVHNRADITIRGLERFAEIVQQVASEFAFTVYFVDDGSTDGTSQRARGLPLEMDIVEGSGSLYWNRGMVLAFQTALSSKRQFDAYMLYNDDVVLDLEFLNLLQTFRSMNDSILVGAFREPKTGEVSYTGYRQVGRLRPFSFVRPELTERLVSVDTFNGNLVLVPAPVFEKLGGLDPGFTHSYGDFDLGLRAKEMGVQSYVYGSTVGVCERGKSLDARVYDADLRGRWKLLFGYPHGLGPYLRFARRHGVAALLPVYAAHTSIQRTAKLFKRGRGLPHAEP